MGIKFTRVKRVVLERCMHEICMCIGSLVVSLGRFQSHAVSVAFLRICGRYAHTWCHYVLIIGERLETIMRRMRRARVDFVA